MDCTAPLPIATLIARAVAVNASSMCSMVVLGGSDVGAEGEFDCDLAAVHWSKLLLDTLIDGDSAIGVDEMNGSTGDFEVPADCAVEGLETLFRRVLYVGADGNKIKVFITGEMEPACQECDDAKADTPLLERMLGSVVKVGDEYRVRVEWIGLDFPAVDNIKCDTVGIQPETLLRGALAYDATTGTWFWNATIL